MDYEKKKYLRSVPLCKEEEESEMNGRTPQNKLNPYVLDEIYWGREGILKNYLRTRNQ